MDGITVTWAELAVLLLIVLAIYIGEMLVFYQRMNRHPPVEWHDPHVEEQLVQLREKIEDLAHRLQAQEINCAEVRIDVERARAEMAVSQVATQAAFVPPAPPAAPPPVVVTQTPYSRAESMVREGYDSRDISVECGIPLGEADLLVALHRRKL